MQWQLPTMSERLRNAGLDKSLLEVAPRVFGRRAVVGNKAAFGRDDDFVAVIAFVGEFFERGADGALASLKPIVDRAVDDVAAGLDGADDGLVVKLVRCVVVVAEIGAETDGGHPESWDWRKCSGANLSAKRLRYRVRACRALRSGKLHRAPFSSAAKEQTVQPQGRGLDWTARIMTRATIKVCCCASVAPPRAMPGPR